MAVRLLMVDNYDSFTFMLVDYLAVLGAEVSVVRADGIAAGDALLGSWDGFVISPGPGRPEDAGASVELARSCIAERRPLLGVCLGHQAVAVACGGSVSPTDPVHGKPDMVSHDGTGVFAQLPSPFAATRYHSLVAGPLPADLLANAWTGDGTIMGFRHRTAPVHGVQFHPESIATEHGRMILAEYLSVVVA